MERDGRAVACGEGGGTVGESWVSVKRKKNVYIERERIPKDMENLCVYVYLPFFLMAFGTRTYTRADLVISAHNGRRAAGSGIAGKVVFDRESTSRSVDHFDKHVDLRPCWNSGNGIEGSRPSGGPVRMIDTAMETGIQKCVCVCVCVWSLHSVIFHAVQRSDWVRETE